MKFIKPPKLIFVVRGFEGGTFSGLKTEYVAVPNCHHEERRESLYVITMETRRNRLRGRVVRVANSHGAKLRDIPAFSRGVAEMPPEGCLMATRPLDPGKKRPLHVWPWTGQ